MENTSILAKIKSNYILKNIFNYILSKNFILKFFVYSNYFKKRLDLQLINYQEGYLNQFNMVLFDYLFFNEKEFYSKDFNKNSLKEKLDNDISKNKLNMNKIECIIIDYFKISQEIVKIELESFNEIPIDIYSPFFNCISKTKFFETRFTINIFVNLIEKFNLKKDYIEAFNELNKSNSNYSSLNFKYTKNDDVKYLEDFNLNFNKIKRLTVIKDISDSGNGNDYNNNYFLEKLFSFNLSNDLVYLSIKLSDTNNTIKSNSIKNLNNLKSLKVLSLSDFVFEDVFLLKIKGLYKLKLDLCENISFDEDIFLNIKYLLLNECNIIIQQEWIYKLPNIENFIIMNMNNVNIEKIFDLTSCKKLKYLDIDKAKFLSIESLKLEKVGLFSYNEKISKESEIRILKKLISLTTLKEVEIQLDSICDDDISTIKDENYSVTKMNLYWLNDKDDCILYNLQNKFKNLKKLVLNQDIIYFKNKILEIKENNNCNVNKITLNKIVGNNIRIYCKSYESLIKLKIELENNINNLENVIPIFSKDCKIKFKSLKTFKFKLNQDESLSKNILNNLYNNIDAMPSLKKISLDFIVPELDEEYFKKFIKKILSLKLYDIHINITKDYIKNDEYYLKNDYKELFPDINFDNEYKEIYIQKFKMEKEKNENKKNNNEQ